MLLMEASIIGPDYYVCGSFPQQCLNNRQGCKIWSLVSSSAMESVKQEAEDEEEGEWLRLSLLEPAFLGLLYLAGRSLCRHH